MIYPIVAYGHPVLKKMAAEIEKDALDVEALTQDMFETMHNAQGIGLAAPQLGKSIRMFVVDGSPLEEEDMHDFRKVFINPEIIEEYGDEWAFEEGCLSIPGIREDIVRPETLRIRYYDDQWNPQEDTFGGMKARIIQHEFDHIEGILFTDHLSAFKRRLLKGKLAGISKGIVPVEYKMLFPQRK